MLRSLKTLVLSGAALACLSAADLPTPMQAKFVSILAKSANSGGKVVCKDANLKAELVKVGMTTDDGASVAWASSESEVKAYKAAGKMVIVPRLDWLPSGGAIAIVDEGGKPQIYLHMGNIAASGVTLSDSILKIGKRL